MEPRLPGMGLAGKDGWCTSIEVDHRDVAAGSHATSFHTGRTGRMSYNQTSAAMRYGPYHLSPPLSSLSCHVALSIVRISYDKCPSQEPAAVIDEWGLGMCCLCRCGQWSGYKKDCKRGIGRGKQNV